MKRSRLIMGSAIGLAAIAVAIDHTRHRLPEPMVNNESDIYIDGSGSPCGLDASPCSLGDSPCALDSSPCSL
jgi:hypothetical protein